MKTSTKIGIGFSIATIAGVYAAVTFSEKIIEKFEHEVTRCKTKKVVDDLSDKELDSINQVVTEIKDGRQKINHLGDKIKTTTENFLDKF